MSRIRVPMRWPAEWTDPRRLELLKGTPVNCLVGEKAPPFPLGDLEFVTLTPERQPEGVAIRQGLWPRVQAAKSAGGSDAESGPTGAPWVDSNAAVIRLAQALEPGKEVWLTYSPPEPNEVVPFDLFALPVAEAGAYGARWLITLQDAFREGLETGNAEAMAAWKHLTNVLDFSARHAEWSRWEPVAALAVLSDFTGDNELLSHEFLNLAPRRHLAYRIVLKSAAASASFQEQKAILYIDAAPPEGDMRARLLDFASQGGLLILPKALPGSGAPGETEYGYNIHTHGKGRIASPIEEWYDPYILAGEVHLLLSHRQDVVRIWNGGLMNSHYVASPDRKRGVVHLVNYGGRRYGRRRQPMRLDDVTVGFAESYQSATVYTPEGEHTVQALKRRLGTEIPLPPFSIYAAIELRG